MLLTYLEDFIYINIHGVTYLKKNLPTLRIRPNPKIKSRGKTLDNNRETRPQDSPFVLGTDTTRNKEEKDRA